jgi:hypothetical protein
MFKIDYAGRDLQEKSKLFRTRRPDPTPLTSPATRGSATPIRRCFLKETGLFHGKATEFAAYFLSLAKKSQNFAFPRCKAVLFA